MPGEAAPPERAFPAQGAGTDLRTLAAEKKPKTVLQKVALVAYYLANHAPANAPVASMAAATTSPLMIFRFTVSPCLILRG